MKGKGAQVNGGIHDRQQHHTTYVLDAPNLRFVGSVFTSPKSSPQPGWSRTLDVIRNPKGPSVPSVPSVPSMIETTIDIDMAGEHPSLQPSKANSPSLDGQTRKGEAYKQALDRCLDTIQTNTNKASAALLGIWERGQFKRMLGRVKKLLRMQKNRIETRDMSIPIGSFMERQETVAGISNTLKSMRDKSESVRVRADQIRQMFTLDGKNPRASRLSKDINEHLGACEITINATITDLNRFHYLYDQLCFPDPYDSEEEATALCDLQASRQASAALYQELSQICNAHKAHKIYFNLELESLDRQTYRQLSFRLAFQGTDHNTGTLVWIRADLPIRAPPDGTTTWQNTGIPTHNAPLQSYKGTTFCPGTLTNSNKFVFYIGANRFLHETKCRVHNPMRLSDWITIREYRDRHSRLRLARLISETVLKLNPALWNETKLRSDHIIISATPVDEGIQSHILITLDKHKASSTNEHRDCEGEYCANLGTVLFNLGITLLELACLETITRPPCFEGNIDWACEEARYIVELCNGETLKGMGHAYAEVVRFCLSDHHEGNIYDPLVQQSFYQKVVRALQKQEPEEATDILEDIVREYDL